MMLPHIRYFCKHCKGMLKIFPRKELTKTRHSCLFPIKEKHCTCGRIIEFDCFWNWAMFRVPNNLKREIWNNDLFSMVCCYHFERFFLDRKSWEDCFNKMKKEIRGFTPGRYGFAWCYY